MQTAYFVLMVVLVAWLMAWAALPDQVAARFWWPFDMKQDPPDTAPGDGADGAAPAPVASWRDRGARRAARGAAAPVARRRREARGRIGNAP